MSDLAWVAPVLAPVLAAVAAAVIFAPVPRSIPAHPRPVPAAPDPADKQRSSLLRASVAFAVGLGVAVLVASMVGVILGVIGSVVAWHVVGRMEPPAVRRRREALTAGLPHVVDLMAASLSVGASPVTVVERISAAVEPPMNDEMAAVSARLRMGVDPVRVWAELGAHPQLGPLGRCLVRAAESGSSVADAMHRLAEDLRRSSRAEVENRARAVGVKAAAPLGLCLLPAFVLVGVVPLVAGSVAVFMGP